MDIENLTNDKKSIERKYIFVVMKDINNNYVDVSVFERIIHNKEINSRYKINNLYIVPGFTLTNREYNQIRDVINDYLFDKKGTAYTVYVSVVAGEIHIDKCEDKYGTYQRAIEIITTYPVKRVKTKLESGALLSDILDNKDIIAYATQEPSIDYFGMIGTIKRGSKEENRLSISSSLASLLMKFFRNDKISIREMNKLFSEESKLGFCCRKAIEEIKSFYDYMSPDRLSPELVIQAKDYGFSDDEIAKACKTIPMEITAIRYGNNIFPNFREMDNSRCGNYHNNMKSYFSKYSISNEAGKYKKERVLLSNNLDEIIEKKDVLGALFIEPDTEEFEERLTQSIYRK